MIEKDVTQLPSGVVRTISTGYGPTPLSVAIWH